MLQRDSAEIYDPLPRLKRPGNILEAEAGFVSIAKVATS
jgi:hypothetical protein